jgi:hypothetical protein
MDTFYCVLHSVKRNANLIIVDNMDPKVVAPGLLEGIRQDLSCSPFRVSEITKSVMLFQTRSYYIFSSCVMSKFCLQFNLHFCIFSCDCNLGSISHS